MHDHAPTCHTKPAGEFHCRMGIPNGLIVSTAPVQLLFNDKRQTPELQQDWKYIPGYDPTHPNRHRAVLKAPKLPSLQAPEFFGNPIADSDARIIYYENLRPKLDPLSEEELAQIKAELTAQKKSISQRSSQEQSEKNSRPSKHELNILKHVQEWEHRNGSLVCFNDVYMALMPGNQSINMLGSRVQSQIVTFYLTSYLSKDRVALAAILPVISSAYRRRNNIPARPLMLVLSAETPCILSKNVHLGGQSSVKFLPNRPPALFLDWLQTRTARRESMCIWVQR